ncbi:MAG: hypothetical protein HQM08_29925 [Candidatus Riflebacteria bacterium]|nr:hypothetical protein [Candidatus Riflebacteria bacterium]
MNKNPILDEIYEFREEYSRKHNFNLDLIYKDLKRAEKENKNKMVILPVKRVFKGKETKVA